MNLILWIYRKSITSSHVYLCTLIFLIWKRHIFYYYVRKNKLFEFILLNVFGCCVFIFLPFGEEEVKRWGAKVLSLCEFKYSCCNSCCQLSLATLRSKNTNLVWQSSMTSWPRSLVKQMPSTTHNHSLMIIMEMCIEVIFRNLDWIGNFH